MMTPPVDNILKWSICRVSKIFKQFYQTVSMPYSILLFSIMHLRKIDNASSEELNFELTQNLIPSPSKPANNSIISLQYTNSQISIENQLEDQVPNFINHSPYSSFKDKECGETTTSTKQNISLAKNSFQTFRSRALSCQHHSSLQKIKPVLTVRPIYFQEQPRQATLHRKGNSTQNFRLKKSISVKEKKNRENIHNQNMYDQNQFKSIQIQAIQNAFKIKSVNLLSNETRGKVYLRKIIQNRASILHISQGNKQRQWQTKRNIFRL